jgi:hypothetical protein
LRSGQSISIEINYQNHACPAQNENGEEFILRDLYLARQLTSAVAIALSLSSAVFAQVASTLADQFTTQERIEHSVWWPTSGRALRDDFLGSQACAECHSVLVKSQAQHAMARASVTAAKSSLLRDHADQHFTIEGYDYKIIADANGSFRYKVSDSKNALSGPLDWAFGAGKVGQSFLSEQNGRFHEIRFSYFDTVHFFGVTPNQSDHSADSLEKAAGRVLSGAEAQRCFGCHTTASTSGNRFDPANAMPGVTCEGCHGPGTKHVSAMKSGDLETGSAAIVNPRTLKPVALVDFCGACHTTWWDAKRIGASGVANVRFQPYRLEASRCWGSGDERLTCPACHNPHQPLVREVTAYDSRCLACHARSDRTESTADRAHVCPVGKGSCVTCHMPKFEVPDMHYQYTDHRIRIVKAGEGFAD